MNHLDLLKMVEKVDAPPYLLTRIQAKIHAMQTERVPTAWKWAGTMTFCCLLGLNGYCLLTTQKSYNIPTQSLMYSLGLYQNYQLYDE
jgi:hypothetical protein